MQTLKLMTVYIFITVIAAGADLQLIPGPTRGGALFSSPTTIESKPDSSVPAAVRYRLDAPQSKFIAHAFAGGPLWFKGHDHLVAVREFTGEAQLSPDSVTTASLVISARTSSMVETSSVFTEQQKQIINKELREIVLLPDQYPEIVFKSTNVTGQSTGSNQYDVKISGNLTLHGVTKPITIPTKLTVTGNDLRALGEFSISRGDFNVKATSAVHGLVRVRDKIKFTFDIVGHQI
jgi:polyisoprenoid-binding protein YceI